MVDHKDMEELKKGWRKVKLGEVAEITKLSGFEFTEHMNYIENGEIIAIRALNVKNGRLDLSEIKRITKETSDKLERSKLYEEDIVFTYTGAKFGEVAIVDKNEKYHLAPNVARIRVNKEYDNYFFFSYFRSQEFKNLIRNYVGGSTQPTIPMGTIRVLDVPLPPLETQQKIASILSSLDDKIELNNEMNKTLEEMAQTLFKRWFIDFEFPNENGEPYRSSGGKLVESELGEIPEGWEVKSLLDIADYLNGLAMQKYRPQGKESLRVIKIREMNNGFSLDSDLCCITIPEKYKIDNGDILFSWSGTLKLMLWNQEKGGLNQHIFKVTSEKFEKWFIYLWTKFHLNNFIHVAESRATTMGHIKRENLKEAKVIIPKENILLKMDKIMIPILEEIINCNKEILSLTKLRDTLLPKLMSGEVEVK